MGSSHDAVMEYMEDELKKDPGVKNKTLFAGAREIDESVGGAYAGLGFDGPKCPHPSGKEGARDR